MRWVGFEIVRVTVDAVGRIVIPKPLRVALGLVPDTELEVVTDGTGLRLEPVRPALRAVGERDGLPLLGFVAGASVADDDVRRLRDELHR